jgi:hypothetical protein
MVFASEAFAWTIMAVRYDPAHPRVDPMLLDWIVGISVGAPMVSFIATIFSIAVYTTASADLKPRRAPDWKPYRRRMSAVVYAAGLVGFIAATGGYWGHPGAGPVGASLWKQWSIAGNVAMCAAIAGSLLERWRDRRLRSERVTAQGVGRTGP